MEKQNLLSSLENEFIAMISKIKKLFEYYCQYGERLNVKALKSHKFVKISKEAEIIDNLINQTRLEIIYKSLNKYNRMNFEQFLNSITKIAKIKYQSKILNENPHLDLKEKVWKLLNDHFLPLYSSIFTTEHNEPIINSNSLNGFQFKDINPFLYSPICEEILLSVCPILFEIYRIYFPHEISISENIDYIKDKSLKQYFHFIKDFEISPGLLSKPQAYQIFLSETQSNEIDIDIANNRDFFYRITKNIDLVTYTKYEKNNHNIFGQYLIFFIFIRIIVKLSEVSFEIIDFKDISSYDKLIMFFQKIELSEGFCNFELKSHKTHSEKKLTIIKQELIDRISEKLEEAEKGEFNNNNNNNNESSSKINSNDIQKEDNERNKDEIITHDNNITINNSLFYSNGYEFEYEYVNYLNEIYGEELLRIFKGLCAYGDPLNYKYMKSKIFMKCLIESNLVKVNNKNTFGLKMSEVDTLFVKLSNLNKNDKNLIENAQNENDLNKTSTTIQNSKVILFKAKNKKDNQAKIEFEWFLIGIEIIAKTLYSKLPPKDAIDKIVNHHIIANLKKNYNIKIKSVEDKIEILKELQNNKEYIKVLEIAYKVMSPIFKFYTKNNYNLMSFDNFMFFAKDFGIFPGMISKAKLNLFYGAISYYSNSNEELKNSEPFIDQSLFIDILALCANDIIYPEPEPNPLEKVIILMEKLQNSEGPEKIIKSTGINRMMSPKDTMNILEEFQKAYPDYFQIQENKKENFIDLMSS